MGSATILNSVALGVLQRTSSYPRQVCLRVACSDTEKEQAKRL
jgi:hypothetical protein